MPSEKAAGTSGRPDKISADPVLARVQQLHNQGMSYMEIASRFGVSESTIRRRLDSRQRRQNLEYVRARRAPMVATARRPPGTKVGQTLPWEGVREEGF